MLFHSWSAYVAANVLLLAVLVVLGGVWPEFKRRARALILSRVVKRPHGDRGVAGAG